MKGLTWLAGALLAVGFAGTAVAEIYQWVDENGHAHYGDQPPKGAGAERIRPQSRGFDSVATESAAVDSAGDDTASPADENEDDADRTARIRREQCEKARARLESYRDAARIQLRQEDGSTRDMTADERVRAIARAEADVGQLCEQ